MTVEELSALHRRYIELSNRLKAAWTFHQCLQGLRKSQLAASVGSYVDELQAVHSALREASQELNAFTTEKSRERLDAVEVDLERLLGRLAQEDARLEPGQLRRFFQRVKSYDDNLLLQLVRFYLVLRQRGSWGDDRTDKVDFLITKVAEEAQGPQGPFVLRSRSQIRQIFARLAAQSGDEPSEAQVAPALAWLSGLRDEIASVGSFDDLLDGDFVARHRTYKHRLGELFFSSDVLLAVAEVNLALKNTIARLHRREGERITAAYRDVFSREGDEGGLGPDELSGLRRSVARYERGLRDDDLSIDALAELRRYLRALDHKGSRPRPSAAPPQPKRETPTEAPPSDILAATREDQLRVGPLEAVPAPRPSFLPAPFHAEVEPYFGQLVAALRDTDATMPPDMVAVSPQLFPYRLEGREVAAFRRLTVGADEEQGGINPDGRETFLLEAAALRSRVQEEVEEVRSILDDSSVTGDAPVHFRARETTRLADRFARRFDHEMEQALLAGDLAEARELQVLRMRLVRESSGLWLLVNKPRQRPSKVTVDS